MKKAVMIIFSCALILCCIGFAFNVFADKNDKKASTEEKVQSSEIEKVTEEPENEDTEIDMDNIEDDDADMDMSNAENLIGEVMDSIKKGDRNASMKKEKGKLSFTVNDVKNVEKLEVEDPSAYITVLKGNSENIQIDVEYDIRVETQENLDKAKAAIGIDSNISNDTCKLTLKKLSNGKSYWTIFQNSAGNNSVHLNVKVYMPTNIKDVKIVTKTGYVYASDVKRQLNVQSETGYVYVSNTEGQMDVTSETGYVYVSDSKAVMNVTTKAGYIEFTNAIFIGKSSAESETGYITSNLKQATEDGAVVTMNTGTGYIVCTFGEKLKYKSSFEMNTKSGSVNLETSNGKVSYEVKKDKKVKCTVDNVVTISATSELGNVFVQ